MQDVSSRFHGFSEIHVDDVRKPLSNHDMEKLAGKILKRIDEDDVSQARVARAIGVDPSQFSKWLKGEGKPKVLQLLALARHLNVSMEYLADDDMLTPDKPSEFSPDEKHIALVFRDLNLPRAIAVQRLSGRTAELKVADPAPGSIRDPRRGEKQG